MGGSGMTMYGAPLAAALIVSATPLAAQTAAPPLPVSAEIFAIPTDPVGDNPASAAVEEAPCELHIWPTHNYLGLNMGLLSGFGVVGALADMGVHADRVKTVKDLMRDYLGPEIQLAELNRIGIAQTLKLNGYRIVIQEPTPFSEDLKSNPVLKSQVKMMNDKIKAKQRLTDSKSRCYAELITTHIFYHKAMMYGSNLFTGWMFRQFGDQQTAIRTASGQVKNPLENFPPSSADKVGPAKAELRDAYAKDFIEYVEKKVVP